MANITLLKDDGIFVYEDYKDGRAARRIQEMNAKATVNEQNQAIRRNSNGDPEAYLVSSAYWEAKKTLFGGGFPTIKMQEQSDDFLGKNLSDMVNIVVGRAQVKSDLSVTNALGPDSPNKAFAKITIVDNSFDDGDIATVNGVAFEVDETSMGAADWDQGATEADSAQNLADAINASLDGSIDGVLTASISPADPTTVLLTADEAGDAGNSLTLAVTDNATTNFNISGATFTGGDDGSYAAFKVVATKQYIVDDSEVITSDGTVVGGSALAYLISPDLFQLLEAGP